mmetsp:Transcript_11623/g.17620  ORF Transcript_11623/g.17620 Transcript_11623/m.17620 type:complete len:122 (-) Transcript_11623:106-471(-)
MTYAMAITGGLRGCALTEFIDRHEVLGRKALVYPFIIGYLLAAGSILAMLLLGIINMFSINNGSFQTISCFKETMISHLRMMQKSKRTVLISFQRKKELQNGTIPALAGKETMPLMSPLPC